MDDPVAMALYIAAYLSAVVDGTMEGTGLYPEGDTGRRGVRRYVREHPWITAGGVCGVLATILVAVN